jgi:predicted transposase YbfD/YdcC
MSRTLHLRLQDGKIRVLEETVESWKRDHEGALLGQEVEDMISGCLSCWEDIRRSWARTQRLAVLNRLGDLQEAGTTILDLLQRSIHLLEDVAVLAEKVVGNTEQLIEGQEDLHASLREASTLREHIRNTWPWDNRPVLTLDRKMVEESRAARTRGESQDVADILAGLQGNASPRLE